MDLYKVLLSWSLCVLFLSLWLSIFTGKSSINTEKSRFDKVMVLILLLTPILKHGLEVFNVFPMLFETGFDGVVFDAKLCIAALIAVLVTLLPFIRVKVISCKIKLGAKADQDETAPFKAEILNEPKEGAK